MPKLNYGFKGSSLTAAQAVAAGAVSTSQDYQYIVQLGAVTPLTAPSAPTSLSATPGNAQVALSWSAPSSAGSSAVTGYQIVYVADDGTEVTATTGGTSQTITGLTNETSYTFVITAVNASAGAGSPASVSATPSSITVPDAPTGLSATAGNGQVTLAWTAPANNGGASITGYAITYSGGTINTGGTTYTVTGLTNGTAYSFSVAAINSVGTGTSSSSATATPASAPAAPTSLTATAGNAQVSLTWTAPSNNGGSSITDYTVQYSSNSGSSWTTFGRTASTTASQVVSSLTNGTAYVFRVAGINANGTGAFTAASSSVTPIRSTDAYFTNVSLLLHADNNGSSFVDSSGSARTITASGNATQSATQSKWGGKSMYLSTAGDYVSAPSSSAFDFSGDSVIEAWIYPTDMSGTKFICGTHGAGASGGSDGKAVLYFSGSGQLALSKAGVNEVASSLGVITTNAWQHVVAVKSGSSCYLYVNGTRVAIGSASYAWSTGTDSFGVGRSGYGSQYTFTGYIDDVRVTVGTDRGFTGSTITVPTAAFPDAGPMFAPTSLAATAGNAQASLTWTAPSYSGGSSITDYSVQYSSNSGSSWSTFSRTASTTTSQVVTGLTNGTAYTFRVAGINSDGTGPYSSTTTATPTAGSSVSFSGSVVVSGANAPTVSGAGTSTLTFTKSNANTWADRVGFTVPSACVITWTPGAASPASYSSPGGSSTGYIYSASSNTLFNQLQKDGTYNCANGRYWANQPWAMYLPAAGTYYFEGQSRASGTVGTLTITSASTITSPISVSGWTQSGLLWSKNTTYGSAASVTVSTKSAVLLATGGFGANLVTSFPFTVYGPPTYQTLEKDGSYHTGGYTFIMILPAGTYSWGGLLTQTPSYFVAVPIA